MENNYKGRGALDAFLNLLTLATLGWFAVSLGQVFFYLIDKFFNPKVDLYFYSQSGLKFSVASLIIITPVFLAVINWLHRFYNQDKLNHQSGVYRWLTYLMLFITSLCIIGSLIALVFNFLDGDYTLATILKILTVFLIAVGIFGYYLYDLRRKEYQKKSPVSLAGFAVVVIIAIFGIVSSFLVIDSPTTARLKKDDMTRINHLSQLSQWAIYQYGQNKVLPQDLNFDALSEIKDPETKQPYEYRVVSQKEYELCATFDLASEKPKDYVPTGMDWYYHNAGYQCFISKIDDLSLKQLQNAMPYAVPDENVPMK